MSGRVLEVVGPSAGGIRRHVDVLARHLPATGWEPVVAAPAGVMDGLATPAVAAPIALDPRTALAARRVLRSLAREVDVVHAHGLTAGWIARAARLGRPLVVTVHNVVLDEAAGRSAPILRLLQRRLPGAVDRTIAVSDDIARTLPADPSIRVIIPASDPPVASRSRHEIRAELGIDDATPLVVAVARLHPQKAIGDLLEAVALVRADQPRARLVVVGDGPSRAALEATGRDLGLGDAVTFVGAQPDGPSWMAAADVVAVSSIWEGSPLVVAEALQLGAPLVATDVGDVAEIVRDGETGRLVAPSAPPQLAAAIADQLRDRAGARAMAEVGRARAAERYGVDRLVGDVARTYEELVARRDPGSPAS
ncbi:MAG: glycosyltransferase family 4 protein [Acidimicrobiales bacterium]|nr:glycosyltransferase family 4 protein [Acidimicrobiales bacterium]